MFRAMTYIPPLMMGHTKPERQRTARRGALYGCKNPWEFVGKAGEVFNMPCRRCIPCQANRRNDLVGKMLAESLSCWDVWVTTLTYDDKRLVEGEKNGAEERCPEHIRAMIHLLRMQGQRALEKQGIKQRIDLSYFAVYETGEKLGRGHWHLILFWKTAVQKSVLASGSHNLARAENPPPVWMPPTSNSYNHPEKHRQLVNNPDVVELRGGKKSQQYWGVWPHGRVTVDSIYRAGTGANVHTSLAYCAKYVAKEQQRYLMSHGVGAAFFMEYMAEHINAGLPISDMTYSFPDQHKLAKYKDRLREKNSVESGGDYRAKSRRRVYQIQGVMRDRCLRYAVRLHRRKVKKHYRDLLPRRGLSVSEHREQIKDAMSLPRIGSELVVRQWERMRFNAQQTSAVLERLQERYKTDLWQAQMRQRDNEQSAIAMLRAVAVSGDAHEMADILADMGHSQSWRTKNRVDTGGPQFLVPVKKGPAMIAREKALSKR